MPRTRDKKVNQVFLEFEVVLATTDLMADLVTKETKASVSLGCPVCPVSKAMLDHPVYQVWTANEDRRVTTVSLVLPVVKETREIAV